MYNTAEATTQPPLVLPCPESGRVTVVGGAEDCPAGPVGPVSYSGRSLISSAWTDGGRQVSSHRLPRPAKLAAFFRRMHVRSPIVLRNAQAGNVRTKAIHVAMTLSQ